MAAKMDSAGLIADYSAAYEAANREPAPKVTYERGWFLFSGAVRTRHRRRALLDMIDVLTTRAVQREG